MSDLRRRLTSRSKVKPLRGGRSHKAKGLFDMQDVLGLR